MSFPRSTLACFLAVLVTSSHGAEVPHEIELLKRNFEAAKERAMTPLRDIYIRELNALALRYQRDGNTDAALAVATELKHHGVDVDFLNAQSDGSKSKLNFDDLVGVWESQLSERNKYTFEFITPENVKIMWTYGIQGGGTSTTTQRFTAEQKDDGIVFTSTARTSRTSTSETWWEIMESPTEEGELQLAKHTKSQTQERTSTYFFRKTE